MTKIKNLFSILKDRQLLVWLVVAIWSVRTAYYGMISKIDILVVKLDTYTDIQEKESKKLDESLKQSEIQHQMINTKLWYIMPTIKTLAIRNDLPLPE